MITALALIIAGALAPAYMAQQSLDAAADALARGDLNTAAQQLAQGLEVDPDNMDVLMAASLLALEQRDYTRAVGLLTHALELDPHNDDARYDLAQAQWRLGDIQSARTNLNRLIIRHPQLPKALELKESLTDDAAAPARPSDWQPLFTADVGVGYDTNVGMVSASITEPTGQEAATSHVEVIGGLVYATRARPFSITGNLQVNSTLNGSRDLNSMMPSSVGLTAIGRHSLGPIDGNLYVQYEELFTDLFSEHYHRLVSTSALGSIQTSSANTIRLLLSANVRTPEDRSTDYTFGGSVRDTYTFGRLAMAGDLGVGKNQGNESAEGEVALDDINFQEISAAFYLDYRFTDTVAAFGIFDNTWREFDDANDFTVFGQVGISVTVEPVDIHAEYAYTSNLSTADDDERNFTRHLVNLGVRYWYD